MNPHILGLSGSARAESYNRTLLTYALDKLNAEGATTETFSFRDHPQPLYDADLESQEGLPDSVLQMRAAIMAADGVVIASPEYNSSITPLLKNAIDWGSRMDPESKQGNVWKGKPILLLGASPGALGGVRALRVVREVFVELQAHVMPQQVAVSMAHEMFNGEGELANERTRGFLVSALKEFGPYIKRFSA
ncbi:MAG: NAD(P)H-dependent oxidoreductase [Fimbriimonadaceae bacterium]|nr:NAD(P)H-dependent oxidoreductase [Fimbriimonadaceae bacterium]